MENPLKVKIADKKSLLVEEVPTGNVTGIEGARFISTSFIS